MKVHRSVGPDEMHLWVLGELAEEVPKPLSITFEKLWQLSEVPADWKMEDMTLFFKREGRCSMLQANQSCWCPARSWRRSIWKLLRHMENKR